ncbi:hypothetical protein PR202_ga03655 [Eleusine coracana subsp. coracana]|uniref:Uncharacterized protein n=1 Tax=Eleusine coracana subsp. coracana TaxID=191504 RepID=A0AAV5BP09_ELECO|nr:hypothetical protein PR202_ga03655 [Eleusine coracana subsp. coracana]
MATAFLLAGSAVVLDDGGAAKRARDDDVLALLEEADARGWSSAVSERSLALRRRRGTTSSSFPRGCGWVTATGDELGCRREEAATSDAVGAGAPVEEVAYFCNLDLAAFDPPLMATPPLPPSAFATDLDGGIIISGARIEGCIAADTADEHGCPLEEAATPDAVGSGPSAADETAMVDPYLSYFCLTL